MSRTHDELIQKLSTEVRGLSAVARHNIQRILAAALVAQKEGGTLLMVEGCRANSIDTHEMNDEVSRRYLPGSHMGMLILQELQKIGAVPMDLPVKHAKESRCTDWEVDAALNHIMTGGRLIGVAGPFNEPSKERADAIAMTLGKKKIDMEPIVVEPEEALGRFDITPTRDQAAILNATTLSQKEIREGLQAEGSAKRTQFISDLVGKIPLLGLHGKRSIISFAANVLPSRKDKQRRETVKEDLIP